MSRESVKIVNATIDVVKLPDGQERLIMRGVLDPDSLTHILVAPYQREVLSGENAISLRKAIKTSTVPDIELGMRGDKYRSNSNESAYYLHDAVYVIDGLQRISAALAAREEDPSLQPRIGCVVFVDTTENWERDRFRILNQSRIKLGASVMVRNLKESHPSIEMLYNLATQDTKFVLYDKVSWSQRMRKGELIPALVFAQFVGMLHSQFGAGRGMRADEIAAQLDALMEKVGRTTMRDNIKTYFDIIDEAFNLRHVALADRSACIKRNFLVALAEIFARHNEFWRGRRLFVEVSLRRKIARFPIHDPYIGQLCSSGGAARDILYQLIIDHINSGKRTKRLTEVEGMEPKQMSTESQSSVAEVDESNHNGGESDEAGTTSARD